MKKAFCNHLFPLIEIRECPVDSRERP